MRENRRHRILQQCLLGRRAKKLAPQVFHIILFSEVLRTHKRSFSIFLWEVISLDRQSPFVGDGIIFREPMKRSLRMMASPFVTAHNTATRHGENSSILLLEEKVENVERCQNFDFLHFVSITSSPGQAWGIPYLVIFEIGISQKRLLGCTSDQDHSNQRPKLYKV